MRKGFMKKLFATLAVALVVMVGAGGALAESAKLPDITASAATKTVINSCEKTSDAWTIGDINNQYKKIESVVSSTGVTEGSHSLKLTSETQWFNVDISVGALRLGHVKEYEYISFDVYNPSAFLYTWHIGNTVVGTSEKGTTSVITFQTSLLEEGRLDGEDSFVPGDTDNYIRFVVHADVTTDTCNAELYLDNVHTGEIVLQDFESENVAIVEGKTGVASVATSNWYVTQGAYSNAVTFNARWFEVCILLNCTTLDKCEDFLLDVYSESHNLTYTTNEGKSVVVAAGNTTTLELKKDGHLSPEGTTLTVVFDTGGPTSGTVYFDNLRGVSSGVVSACADSDKNHACDVCGVFMGTHQAASTTTHICSYCEKSASDCVDITPKDHACDVCGASMGTHQAASGKHTCDYCGQQVTTCADSDKDHKCDVCGASMGTHQAASGKHTCDYCGQQVTTCADSDKDHKCDVCGATVSECADTNPKDHKCDVCGATVSECADTNPKDHKCDVCGASMGTHQAASGKHICDYCGETLTTCADTNPKDHKCDVCGATVSECADTNPKDHKCDVCNNKLSDFSDTNHDEKCDVCGTDIRTFIGGSLSMEGDIAVNFYVTLAPCISEEPEAQVTIYMENQLYFSTSLGNIEKDEKTGYYRITCGVPPKDYDKTLRVELSLLGSNPVVYDGTAITNYIANAKNTYETGTVIYETVVALENYCKAAKEYFLPDEVTGESLPELDLDVSEVMSDPMKYTVWNTDNAENLTYKDFEFNSITLVFETETKFRLYVYTDNISKYRVYTYMGVSETLNADFINASVEQSWKHADWITTPDGEGGMEYYYVEVSGIAASDLDKKFAITVELTDGTSTKITYTCSVYNYMRTVFKNEKADKKLVKLLTYMYVYHQQAANYNYANA